MPRTTKSVTAKAKHKKVLSATKGHYGARSRLFRTAKQSNIKSLQYAFRDRKNKKRAFRALWIARINAGARELGVSYSVLINSLIKKDILIDEEKIKPFVKKLDQNIEILSKFTDWIKDKLKSSKDDASAACNDYLKVLGLVATGHAWIKVLEVSFKDYENNKDFYEDKIHLTKRIV